MMNQHTLESLWIPKSPKESVRVVGVQYTHCSIKSAAGAMIKMIPKPYVIAALVPTAEGGGPSHGIRLTY